MNKKILWESEEVFQPSTNQQQQKSPKSPNAYQAPEGPVSEIKCFEVYLNSKGLIQYFCILCGETIENSMNHVFHLRQHFNGNLSCKDWKDHCNNNKGFNLYSSSCNEIFDGLYDFINHLNNIHYNNKNEHSRKIVEQMACMYCNQEFDDPHKRLEHITMIHLRDDTFNRNKSDDVVSTYPMENLIVDCFDKGSFIAEQANNADPNTFNDDTYNITKMVRHKLSNKRNKTLTTKHKSSAMSNKPDLKLARDINSNIEQNDDISRVKWKTHVNELTQMCEFCGKMYTSMHNLTVHINSIHTKLTKFICSVCYKSFSHPSSLKPHMRVHNDEKPYECKLCDKKYRTAGHLSSHMLRHNNIRRHPCTTCDKKFFNPEQLRSHLNVHSGVKPYTCDICDTNFRTPDALRSHRRLHTGEKPYECKVCSKRFPTLAGLYGHTKSNHR